MSDRTNDLMRRCLAAHDRCEEAGRRAELPIVGGPSEDFQVVPYAGIDGMITWRVGFYERDYGKQIADAWTLDEALDSWLDEYEHRWDALDEPPESGQDSAPWVDEPHRQSSQ